MLFFSKKNENLTPKHNGSLASHEDMEYFLHSRFVVIYYGIAASVCIVFASKAAKSGVNPFESLGINFKFIGILFLVAPLIIWMERKRYLDESDTQQNDI